MALVRVTGIGGESFVINTDQVLWMVEHVSGQEREVAVQFNGELRIRVQGSISALLKAFDQARNGS